MDADQDRLVVLGAMARRLGVPTKWLRAEADAGRLPHVQAGNTLLFVPDVVTRLLAKRASELKPISQILPAATSDIDGQAGTTQPETNSARATS